MKLSFIFKFLALFTFTLGVDVQALLSNPDDVEFYLYANPSDTTDAQKIVYRDPNSLTASTFNCTRETKFIIHGFGGNGTMDTAFPGNVKHEYLKLHYYNIFTVDYWKLSSAMCPEGPLNTVCYLLAMANTQIVGGRVADFIIWLREICGPELGFVHVVAHSLGCVVAGWAGITVIDKTESPIDRISGLDPAGPVYEGTIHTNLTNILRQLKPGDAGFTDVYHTSCISGNLEKHGMMDLYINGAGVLAAQPECLDLIGVIEDACNHASSTKHWAKSIAGDPNDKVCVCNYGAGVIDQCCDEQIVIGEYCDPTTRGTLGALLPAPLNQF